MITEIECENGLNVGGVLGPRAKKVKAILE